MPSASLEPCDGGGESASPVYSVVMPTLPSVDVIESSSLTILLREGWNPSLEN